MVVLWLPRTAIVKFKMQSWSPYFVRCIRNRRRFKEIQTANFTHNWIPTAKVTGRFNSDSVRYRNFIRNSRRRDPRAFGHLASFVRLAVGAFRKLSRGGKGEVLGWGRRRRRFRIHVMARTAPPPTTALPPGHFSDSRASHPRAISFLCPKSKGSPDSVSAGILNSLFTLLVPRKLQNLENF